MFNAISVLCLPKSRARTHSAHTIVLQYTHRITDSDSDTLRPDRLRAERLANAYNYRLFGNGFVISENKMCNNALEQALR